MGVWFFQKKQLFFAFKYFKIVGLGNVIHFSSMIKIDHEDVAHAALHFKNTSKYNVKLNHVVIIQIHQYPTCFEPSSTAAST